LDSFVPRRRRRCTRHSASRWCSKEWSGTWTAARRNNLKWWWEDIKTVNLKRIQLLDVEWYSEVIIYRKTIPNSTTTTHTTQTTQPNQFKHNTIKTATSSHSTHRPPLCPVHAAT
jgi:hypothetical protein